ncbi:MAG: septum formation protein Maf [Eggerthellaceae bacterium]|nr:septum formation protein Maf [Eggerthellaceae bacterium]
MNIVLASQSPRRSELLEQAGVTFSVHVSEADEGLAPEERANPAAAACMLADRKAGVVVQEILDAEKLPSEPTMIIGADTMVVLDGQIFGKPHTPSEATGMLRKLSGRTHEVVTGVAVWGIMPDGSGKVSAGHTTFHETSHVTFRDLSDAEIAAYVAQGEYYDKAGSYAIQGAGGQFVERYEGPLDNIIGLPVAALLERFPDMVG